MNSSTRASYNDFINRSFRDVADKDYIAARMLYRYKLGTQFLWSAQQAIEKYLKAILLYNDQSTKPIGHDLEKAFRKLDSITDIPFEFPENVPAFISYLTIQGNNRYFEKYAYTTGDELLMLDQAVWYIRRYCYYMRGHSTPGPEGNRIDMFPIEITKIRTFPVDKANKYKIFGGYLEKLLRLKKSELRKYLVWKNFYYGTYKKKIIKNFDAHSWSANPAHYLNPDLFSILKDRVKFSKEVKEMFSQRNQND